ncbi:MAG: hypothetical protein LJE91_18430 [Gammaproteobacteria bacterium]|jgi:hypothetical protein|nr:hypothetical protein [Gammaproteobacteria bacterium]
MTRIGISGGLVLWRSQILRTLIILVAVMSAVFLLTMMIVKPDIRALFRGLL